jgi:cell wall-associated NlpC family hydrolase
MANWKKFVALPLFSIALLLLVSGYSNINAQEKSKDYQKKGNSENKINNDFAATDILKEKNTISRGSLESISSTLAGFVASTESETSMDRDEVMYKVIEYINTPYLWGGTSKRGIDCSAFVQTVLYQALGVSIPRTSLEQSQVGQQVSNDELKFGDLVFFDTMRKGRVTHVGIYLADGYFVHSGSSTGVAVASLNSDFYSRVFLKAMRVIDEK